MKDEMSALAMKTETPPVKMEELPATDDEKSPPTPAVKLEEEEVKEGEIAEGDRNPKPQLVAYSSSPTPLIEDCPGLIGSDVDSTQHSVIAPLRGGPHRDTSPSKN